MTTSRIGSFYVVEQYGHAREEASLLFSRKERRGGSAGGGFWMFRELLKGSLPSCVKGTLSLGGILAILDMLQELMNHGRGSKGSEKFVMKEKKEGKTGMDAEKDSLQNIKKGKKFFEEREYFANDEEKKEERYPELGAKIVVAGSNLVESVYRARKGRREELLQDIKKERNPQDEPVFPWVERELSMCEGNDTQFQTKRATNASEVQITKGSTKHQKSKNLSWEDLATTLLRIAEGNRRRMLCESLAAKTQIRSVEILHESLTLDGGNTVNHSNLVGSSFHFLGTRFSNDMWWKKVLCFHPLFNYTVKSSFVGNNGAVAENVVATRADEATPYHDGLFLVDVFFLSSYAIVPLKVHYHSVYLTLGLAMRMRSNQVEVSIQGLILNSKPYCNEPGFAHLMGSKEGTFFSHARSQWFSRSYVASDFPSYDNTLMKMSHEIKFHYSNLEDKVVLQQRAEGAFWMFRELLIGSLPSCVKGTLSLGGILVVLGA
ncbi:hypothetical protein V8G54_011111 [Vigna mungo]|uniref:Uncharacterized protein n=1 Tax=Vigna mungo TaxID=3915 RepID=A0AAQ3NN67_VIGMU